MWFPRKFIVSTEIFFKTGKFPSSSWKIFVWCQRCIPQWCKTLQFLCFRIEKDLILFMANREGRFKKIRSRSTPNSTAKKHKRCFQLKPHSLFARFHSRERLLGRRTAVMCSFVISNKTSTSLSSNIYRSSQSIQPFFFVLISSSSQCTMIWTAVAALQALSDHIDYSWNNQLHSTFLFVQFFQLCFLTTCRRCHIGENLWYFGLGKYQRFVGRSQHRKSESLVHRSVPAWALGAPTQVHLEPQSSIGAPASPNFAGVWVRS